MHGECPFQILNNENHIKEIITYQWSNIPITSDIESLYSIYLQRYLSSNV